MLSGRSGFAVHNAGLRPQGRGYVYDVSENPDGSVNDALVSLARDVESAVAPIPCADEQPASERLRAGAVSCPPLLASHDLYVRPDLYEEVGAFIAELEVPVSRGILRWHGRDVPHLQPRLVGAWWRTMTWEHVRTWRLAER